MRYDQSTIDWQWTAASGNPENKRTFCCWREGVDSFSLRVSCVERGYELAVVDYLLCTQRHSTKPFLRFVE